ncbi:MAG: potassium-transporting ATPase subunit KdpC [Chloroflexi bacterium]|nr:potassium-transporting ATPase subunit KdpC [Chloroflexota bacterium]
MTAQLRPAIVSLLLLTILTGLVYPLAVTGIAQVAFPYQANGSVMMSNGQKVGSALIGQDFSDPRYFWGRLSATGPAPYNAAASSGSNLGPTNPALLKAVQARVDALRAADPTNKALIPVNLVTASASGLDPQISPAAAEYQVARIAQLRNMSVDQVRQLVAKNTAGRQFDFLGEPRVNVLSLNLALDQVK